MRGLLGVAVALAGCGQLFGLQPPELAADATAPRVSGRFVLRYVHNTAMHEPMVDETPFPSLDVTARLDDGTSPQVDVQTDGSFSFTTNAPGQHYRLRFTIPGGFALHYDHDAPTLALYGMRMGRLATTGAPAGTTLTYNLSDIASLGSLIVFTSGAYMTTSVASATMLTIDWSTMTNPADPPALLETAKYDRTYALYLAPSGGRVSLLTRYRADDVDLAAGANTSISGTTLPVTADRCVHARALAGSETGRVTAAGYVSTAGSPEAAYGVSVQPSFAIGSSVSALAAYQQITPPAETTLMFMTGSPVPGTFVHYMTVMAPHDIAGPAGVFRRTVGTTHVAPLNSDCTVPIELGGGVALPGIPRLDDKVLDQDGPIAIERSHDLTLTWPSSVVGPVDVTRIGVYEVTATDVVLLQLFITTRDRVLVDPDVFARGKTYVFFIQTETGWRGAQSGDFGVFALPFATGQVYSSAFTLAN